MIDESATRTFRLCSRSTRDGAFAGMAVCLIGGAILGALLLFTGIFTPRSMGWLQAALLPGAALLFTLFRRAYSSSLTVGPAGLRPSRRAGSDSVIPWSSVEAVEIRTHRSGFRHPALKRPEAPWALIRARGGQRIAVPGEIEGFRDLMAILRRHVPAERWRDTRPDTEGSAAT